MALVLAALVSKTAAQEITIPGYQDQPGGVMRDAGEAMWKEVIVSLIILFIMVVVAFACTLRVQ